MLFEYLVGYGCASAIVIVTTNSSPGLISLLWSMDQREDTMGEATITFHVRLALSSGR